MTGELYTRSDMAHRYHEDREGSLAAQREAHLAEQEMMLRRQLAMRATSDIIVYQAVSGTDIRVVSPDAVAA